MGMTRDDRYDRQDDDNSHQVEKSAVWPVQPGRNCVSPCVCDLENQTQGGFTEVGRCARCCNDSQAPAQAQCHKKSTILQGALVAQFRVRDFKSKSLQEALQEPEALHPALLDS